MNFARAWNFVQARRFSLAQPKASWKFGECLLYLALSTILGVAHSICMRWPGAVIAAGFLADYLGPT